MRLGNEGAGKATRVGAKTRPERRERECCGNGLFAGLPTLDALDDKWAVDQERRNLKETAVMSLRLQARVLVRAPGCISKI